MANILKQTDEERLLRTKELEQQSEAINFELAKIREEESKRKKKKELITDFNELKFVAQGDRMLSSQAFDKKAVYEYLNEEENTITLFNGVQAEATFGTNTMKKENFGMLQSGSMYRVAGKFTLRFKYYEVN
jgi:hypothetical protein